jgi:glutathione S-transferase
VIVLHSYNVSPYAAKVRGILRYKGLAFEERVVHPLRRQELERVSGQSLVPVVEDGADVVSDSTRIAAFLDERYPERPILPRAAGERARVLLVEDWADEALVKTVQPVRWLIPANAARTIATFRSAYPAGRADDLTFAVVGRVLKLDQRRKYGNRAGQLARSAILERLAETADLLDGALAETGFLCAATPTVADFAAWGFVSLLDGLDGWETIKARKHLYAWHKSMLRGAPARDPSRRLPVA